MPRVGVSAPNQEKTMKIYPFVAGRTLDTHINILKKLTKKGAEVVDSPQQRDLTIIFCPICSRYETDLNSALDTAKSEIPDLLNSPVIILAMFHTVNPDYNSPRPRDLKYPVDLLVNCLFHETKGFFDCEKNKEACESVRSLIVQGRKKKSASCSWCCFNCGF